MDGAEPVDPFAIFGSWDVGPEDCKVFRKALPFPHTIIDDFLTPSIANKLETDYPAYETTDWHSYMNPMEVKLARNDIHKLPDVFRTVFAALQSEMMLGRLRRLTGIDDLQSDEYYYGAGLHMLPRHGRLMMHLGYDKHPITSLQRRVNIILYLSRNWKPEWGGQTELGGDNDSKSSLSIDVRFNRALIFRTDNESWYGVPKNLTCPQGEYRRTLAVFYVSPLDHVRQVGDRLLELGCGPDGYRAKALFRPRTEDQPHPGLDRLIAIRPHRRLTNQDVRQHCPRWSPAAW